MTKYLIFNNSPSSGKSNVPGSPEDIACDIARVIEDEGNSKDKFISFPEISMDATFASLQGPPRFAMELDQSKINTWINDALPLIIKFYGFNEIIEVAYGDVLQAVTEIQIDLKKTAISHDLDLFNDLNIGYGFEAISHLTDFDFLKPIAEYFNVEVFEYHPVGRS